MVIYRNEIDGGSVAESCGELRSLGGVFKQLLNAVSVASEGCVMLGGPGGCRGRLMALLSSETE